MTETTDVLVSDAGGVRSIAMNRPDKRNALTAAMYQTMADALLSADEDAAIGAVLISGRGGHFTGGNDLGDFMNNPPLTEDNAVFRFLHAILGFGKPVVAAVEGNAVGIGTTMLLHCDLIYAAPTARFAMPFVDLGLVPEAASSLLVPRLLGHPRAAEMLMLGAPMSAEEAARTGLINAVVPAEQLDAHAAKVAAALAAKPRTAMRHTKALLRGDRGHTREVMSREGRLFAEMLVSPEAKAAFAAFFAKKG